MSKFFQDVEGLVWTKSLAVNGKAPIAAWVPSLDTAGNGTNLLTDLSRYGNNGMLTNMDAATDWVADTGAGGVRALDFDGTNGFVDLLAPAGLSADFAVSLWYYPRTSNAVYRIIWETNGYRQSTGGIAIYQVGTNFEVWRYTAPSTVTRLILATSGVGTVNNWHNLILKRESGSLSLYRNTTQIGSTASDSQDYDAGNLTGKYNFGGGRSLYFFDGRADDLRVFSQVLDATDVAYLYNSGSGRGRLAA